MVDDWVTELDEDEIESLYDEWVIDDDDMQELYDDWYIDWSNIECIKKNICNDPGTEYVSDYDAEPWVDQDSSWDKSRKKHWWNEAIISNFSRGNLVLFPFILIWDLLIIIVAIWLEVIWIWFLFWSVIWVILVLIFAPWLFGLPLALFWFLTPLRPD